MMKHKKIIYFVDDLNHGGIENIVLQLSNRLCMDYDIHVISLYENQNDIVELFNSNVKIHYLPFNEKNKGLKQYILSLNILNKIIRDVNPDIIHAHNSSGSYLYLALAIYISKIKCKNIRTLHFTGSFLERKSTKDKIRLFIDQLAAKITRTIIIGVSPIVTNIAKKYYNPNNIITICNGVDCMGRFNPMFKHLQPLVMRKNNSHDLNVVYVARLCEGKGHKILFDAWKELMKKYDNLHLYIIGDGSLLNEFKSYLKEKGIFDSVNLIGAVSNVEDYLAYSDIAVFPSLSEGFSLVLLEKMAMRLPVIASSIPAFQYIIENNKNGILFSLSDSKDLIDKIELLIYNSSLRREIGENARKNVVEKFSIDNMIEMHKYLYNISLLSTKNRGRLKIK